MRLFRPSNPSSYLTRIASSLVLLLSWQGVLAALRDRTAAAATGLPARAPERQPLEVTAAQLQALEEEHAALQDDLFECGELFAQVRGPEFCEGVGGHGKQPNQGTYITERLTFPE